MPIPEPPPVTILPFSLAGLRAILPEPSVPLDQCGICSQIAPHVTRLVKGGDVARDDIPPATAQLRCFLRLGANVNTVWVGVCPTCHRLYYVEHSYEFLIGGSEDYDAYQRLTADEVVDLPEVSWVVPGDSELHQSADGSWAIAAPRPSPA